ncbi:tumor necrosis factor receptor superfamily member 8 isoform X1 [Falco peregrinus]|uniref:tumor necrosis factor receptor superfamily member 8 isoform X1 n=1 Tax=Falco peregrinus TaxID=8954 RepID=UPI000FFC9C63|nr:tumor necrosis factor receptor superfamily member 8 isoform X1 [Falco peregrinus]XP_027643929.1 tumor necrosis factor receptor superfamily member 8 isoform X1 [Falco peregrinus]
MAACSLAQGLCLLLLLQDIQTAPQTSLAPSHSCDTLENWFYDETSRSCCYKCPSGYVKKKACPRDPDEDCMTCGPEQYVNEELGKPQCDACVLCAKESELVEKKPCSFNSSRVCECRPGLFCQMAVKNTCLRCQQHAVCKPGFGVKVRGTSTNDVTCEECPSGTFSDQSSSTDVCKPHTNCAKLNKVAVSEGNATHDQVCLDQLPTYLIPSTLSVRFSNETNNSDLRRFEESLVTIASILLSATTTENPSSTPEEKALAGTFPTSAKEGMTTGGLVLWGVVLSVIVLLVGMLLFWKRKVCKKRILILKAKPHLQSVSSHKSGLGSQGSDLANKCAIILTTDSRPEEEELIDRTLPLETNNNLVSSTEKACGPHLSLTDLTQSNGNAPDCPIDSRVRDHTNNRIEKIYIMKADTVIVGSVSEVPSGKNCAARGCESNVDAQESMEEELAMHYPEQETESFPGNDVTVPVEEEGKEFHHPTTATEKW